MTWMNMAVTEVTDPSDMSCGFSVTSDNRTWSLELWSLLQPLYKCGSSEAIMLSIIHLNGKNIWTYTEKKKVQYAQGP